MDGAPVIRFSTAPADVQAAHALLLRRMGPELVEDAASFAHTASEETAGWAPVLALAEIDGDLAGVLLGGLLPAVRLLSLPYTAIDERFERRGLWRLLKAATIARLQEMAAARGLPPPLGNVSEEEPDGYHYHQKLKQGAILLPVPYRQPAEQGLAETELALTFDPFPGAPAAFTPPELLAIVAALYRALYRIARPEDHPAYQRIRAALGERQP